MEANGFGHLELEPMKSRTYLGQCEYRHYNHAKRRWEASKIRLSESLCYTTPEEVRETTLHELAHAVAGHEAGHGPRWKAAAVRLGAVPRRCASLGSKVNERINLVMAKYVATCNDCGEAHYFDRLTKIWKRNGYRCRKCKGNFTVKLNNKRNL